MPPGVDDVVSRGARDRGLRRNPDETFARWQFDSLQRVQHRPGIGGLVRSAMNPDRLMIRARLEHLFLGGTVDRHQRDYANTLCQIFDAAADGRQRGFVTDEKPPIEVGRDQERASRAADLYGFSDLDLLRPPDRRSSGVQRDVDGQLFGFGIEVSRREVTAFEIAASLLAPYFR